MRIAYTFTADTAAMLWWAMCSRHLEFWSKKCQCPLLLMYPKYTVFLAGCVGRRLRGWG
jgi:hypothetical protein